MNKDMMQKQVLAARDAHTALLELKQIVDEVTQSSHAAELDAVGMTCSLDTNGRTRSSFRVVTEMLRSENFERVLNSAKQKAETAVQCQREIAVQD